MKGLGYRHGSLLMITIRLVFMKMNSSTIFIACSSMSITSTIIISITIVITRVIFMNVLLMLLLLSLSLIKSTVCFLGDTIEVQGIQDLGLRLCPYMQTTCGFQGLSF